LSRGYDAAVGLVPLVVDGRAGSLAAGLARVFLFPRGGARRTPASGEGTMAASGGGSSSPSSFPSPPGADRCATGPRSGRPGRVLPPPPGARRDRSCGGRPTFSLLARPGLRLSGPDFSFLSRFAAATTATTKPLPTTRPNPHTINDSCTKTACHTPPDDDIVAHATAVVSCHHRLLIPGARRPAPPQRQRSVVIHARPFPPSSRRRRPTGMAGTSLILV
jgi:hypothetical protein